MLENDITGSGGTVAEALFGAVEGWARAHRDGPLVVGVCGAQGSGKSTVCGLVAEALEHAGLPNVVLGLDDYYLSRHARQALAEAVHPLFATRGPPLTHDLEALAAALAALRAGEGAVLRRFEKAHDDVAPEAAWPHLDRAVRVVFLEGWCIGARPQDGADLAEPINSLEADEDRQAVWRMAVNAAFAGPYRQVFDGLDKLVLLAAPSFNVVQRWRSEQEATTARLAGGGSKLMTEAQIARFIQHYERVTRHILAEMPTRADLVLSLDEERRLVRSQLR